MGDGRVVNYGLFRSIERVYVILGLWSHIAAVLFLFGAFECVFVVVGRVR